MVSPELDTVGTLKITIMDKCEAELSWRKFRWRRRGAEGNEGETPSPLKATAVRRDSTEELKRF